MDKEMMQVEREHGWSQLSICGDSRAVLCRKSKPIPLTFDRQLDHLDELNQMQEAGGRVIY